VQRKTFEREFCVPFQEEYETKVPEALSRYSMVVDGEILDSRRVNDWRLRKIPIRELAVEIGRRIKRRVGLKID
jgi:hypothetical protein